MMRSAPSSNAISRISSRAPTRRCASGACASTSPAAAARLPRRCRRCGTRCAKDRWAFVRHVLESIAAGRTRREAVRFAGRGNCKELRILFGFGEPLDMLVNEDGSWSHPDQVASRLNFGTQFKRLTRCGSALLRKVPRVAAKT